jgi:hypothetical protein
LIILRITKIMKELFIIRTNYLIFIIYFFKNQTIRKKSIELTIDIFIEIFFEIWNWFLILMFFGLFFFDGLTFIFSDGLIWNNFIMLIILTRIDLWIIKVLMLIKLIFKFIKLLILFIFTVEIKRWAGFELFIRGIFLCLLSMKFVFIINFHPIILITAIILLWRIKNSFLVCNILTNLIFLLRRSKEELFILEIGVIILV